MLSDALPHGVPYAVVRLPCSCRLNEVHILIRVTAILQEVSCRTGYGDQALKRTAQDPQMDNVVLELTVQ